MTEDFEDESCNPSIEPSIGVLMSRRALLGGAVAAAALPALPAAARAEGNGPSSFTFKEVPHVLDETHHVADGYDVQVLIRWGDPVLPGAPAFDPLKQTAASQALQFGYNNDFLGLHALPAGSTSGDRFLLVVNHEYVNSNLMFEGVGEGREARLKATAEQVGVEMAAQGGGAKGRERSPLSTREREIVALVAQGYKNKEMAEKMFISEQTVKNHLHNIFDKLGVSDRLELALYAIHKGLHLAADAPKG